MPQGYAIVRETRPRVVVLHLVDDAAQVLATTSAKATSRFELDSAYRKLEEKARALAARRGA